MKGAVLFRACRWCKRKRPVEFTTRDGWLIETVPECCDRMVRNGRCVDCQRARSAPGSIRCPSCRRVRNTEKMRRYRARHPHVAVETNRRARERERAKRPPRYCLDCPSRVYGRLRRGEP